MHWCTCGPILGGPILGVLHGSSGELRKIGGVLEQIWAWKEALVVTQRRAQREVGQTGGPSKHWGATH